jgi:prepilin-type N-terminal cleavage/methylation domain-containing protein
VKTLLMKGHVLREERGFSLPEMMVTILVMIIMFLALHSIFDMSVRVFAFGNNKTEAMESARVGLEKMEREIRAAYPVDSNDPANTHVFFSANGATSNPPQAMPDATQITFGNDLGAGGAGNKKIDCLSVDTCEYITYKLTDDNSNAACTASPCDLRRVNTANSVVAGGDPLVENVLLNGLAFTYYESDGTTAESEGEIIKVRVRLQIAVAQGTSYEARQVLATEVDLRNRQ